MKCVSALDNLNEKKKERIQRKKITLDIMNISKVHLSLRIIPFISSQRENYHPCGKWIFGEEHVLSTLFFATFDYFPSITSSDRN